MNGNRSKRPLPPGWRWARLGEVCGINPRRPQGFRRRPEAPTTFVPMSAVEHERGIVDAPETRPYQEVARGYTYFQEGDVLFAKITPCMQNGKAAIAAGLLDGIGFGSTEFHVLRPSSAVRAEWVHFFVRRPRFRDEAARHFTGTVGHQRVPDEFLSTSLIPVPPPDEQQRIAARLSEQTATVERMRRSAEAQVEAARALPASIIRQVFDSEEAKRWPRRRLGDVCRKPQYGYTASATTEEVGPKLLRITDIQNGQVDWDSVPYCNCPSAQEAKYLLGPGDILFVRSGATTGKSFLVEDAPRRAIFASYLIRLRAGPDLLPRFAYLFLQSDLYWRQVAIGRRGGAQPNMNATLLAEVLMPLPLPEVQDGVTAQLSGVLIAAEELRQVAEARLQAVNTLPATLLEEVFGGFEAPAKEVMAG